jgi:hypothetical protein
MLYFAHPRTFCTVVLNCSKHFAAIALERRKSGNAFFVRRRRFRTEIRSTVTVSRYALARRPGMWLETGTDNLRTDGGGIRGLSELIVIEEIMERVRDRKGLQVVPIPAEYFDLIGGTSTGG